ncbi:unnamed protein product [Lactuca virosa]|uniref:DYW domain-containing protein n=1 Tax=Lactuca virosa TaxID=75947 RepID=A0AAU9LFM0_9ASTR|nr:unnamed protein product [Lactuca virosa]
MNQSRVYGNMELGDHCVEMVNLLQSCRLDEQSRKGLILNRKKKKKSSEFNLVGVKTKVRKYKAGDTSHPNHEKFYRHLQCLKQHMIGAGYVAETESVVHDVNIEAKEESLLIHSERLYLVEALLTSPARARVLIYKNLRVCVDCHKALKIILKVVGREIIARDAKRLHHAKNGVCSCRDYWR